MLPLQGDVQVTYPGDVQPAYLIRLPESLWDTFQRSRGGITATLNDGGMNLWVAGERIQIEAHEGTSTDIHSYDVSLSQVAVASTRLNVPLKSQPAVKLPLKTRVIQLLAIGPLGAAELVGRIEGSEGDIMRVVKAVGRCHHGTYSLLPNQYAKIKLDYDYTSQDLEAVIRHAFAAFDELNLPSDAAERIDLENKIALLPSPPSTDSSIPISRAQVESSDLPGTPEDSSPAGETPLDGDTAVDGTFPSASLMRDRYEELYPAYQNLTRKLVGLYHASDDSLESGVENMVLKWRRWHEELAEIRRWFTE